jgi:DNA topoisomerase III
VEDTGAIEETSADNDANESDSDNDAFENMGCNSCLHPSCKQSAIQNGICKCPGTDATSGELCKGMLILDVNSKPHWKLACNQPKCHTLIRFHGDIHLITPQPKIPCPECGVKTVVFEFSKTKSPLPNGATTLVGCVICDEFLNSITEVVVGRAVSLKVVRQERYRRGANGRGFRGGRGGRGGRTKGDVKMSFSDF